MSLIQSKNYFVITTNVDNQFENASFPKEKYFEVQGNHAYLQCATPCHDTIYFNKDIVSSMLPNIYKCKVPTELVPRCPMCGGKMDIYLHKDKRFLKGAKWENANQRYMQFLQNTINKKIVYFELGVGFSTPKIIRFPFERLKTANPFSTLIRVNKEFPNASTEIHDREITFQNDIGVVIQDLFNIMT